MAPILTPATLQALQAASILDGSEVESVCVIGVFNDPPKDDAPSEQRKSVSTSEQRRNPSTSEQRRNPSTSEKRRDPAVQRTLNAAAQSPIAKLMRSLGNKLQRYRERLGKRQARLEDRERQHMPEYELPKVKLEHLQDAHTDANQQVPLGKPADPAVQRMLNAAAESPTANQMRSLGNRLQQYRDELGKRQARLEAQEWQYMGEYESLKVKLEHLQDSHTDANQQLKPAFSLGKLLRGWAAVERECDDVKQEQKTLQSDKKRLNDDWKKIGEEFVSLQRHPLQVSQWLAEHLHENHVAFGSSHEVKALLHHEMETQMQEMEMMQQRREVLGLRLKIVKEQLLDLTQQVQVQSAIEQQARLVEQQSQERVPPGLQQMALPSVLQRLHQASDALHLNTLEWTKADLEGTLEQNGKLLKTLQQRLEELEQSPYDLLFKECSVDQLKVRYVDFLQRIDVEENRLKKLRAEQAPLLREQEKVNSMMDKNHKKLEAAKLEEEIKRLKMEELQQQEKVGKKIHDTLMEERQQLKRYLEQKGVSAEELKAIHELHKQQFALQTHLAGELKKHLKSLDLREANLQDQHYRFDGKLKLLQTEYDRLKQETQNATQPSRQGAADAEIVDKLQQEWEIVAHKYDKVKREQQSLEREKTKLRRDWEAALAVLNSSSQSPPLEMQALAHREQETLWEEEKMLQQRREILSLRFKIMMERLDNLNEQLQSAIERRVQQPRRTNALHDLQQLAHLVNQARHLIELEHTKATLEGKVEHSDVLLMRLQPGGIHMIESSLDSGLNEHSVDELKTEYADLMRKFDAQENKLKKLRDAKAQLLHEQEKVNSVMDAKPSQRTHLKEEIKRLKGELLDKEEKVGEAMLKILMEKRREVERRLGQKGARLMLNINAGHNGEVKRFKPPVPAKPHALPKQNMQNAKLILRMPAAAARSELIELHVPVVTGAVFR